MTTTSDIDLAKMEGLRLSGGGHSSPDSGLCLMEAVAYVRGIEHTDTPPCVSLVLGEVGRTVNDTVEDEARQRLVPLIPALPGTAGDGHDPARVAYVIDWTIRTWLPLFLDLDPAFAEQAAAVRALPPLTAVPDPDNPDGGTPEWIEQAITAGDTVDAVVHAVRPTEGAGGGWTDVERHVRMRCASPLLVDYVAEHDGLVAEDLPYYANADVDAHWADTLYDARESARAVARGHLYAAAGPDTATHGERITAVDTAYRALRERTDTAVIDMYRGLVAVGRTTPPDGTVGGTDGGTGGGSDGGAGEAAA